MIDRNMTIEEIFQRFPGKSQKLAQEMANRGLNCVGCSASTWETLEAGMLGHGCSEDEIEGLLKQLNEILLEQEDPHSVQLTKRAAEKYKAILADESKEGWNLRLGEKAAGCSGFEYFLDYSEKAGPEDETFASQGLEIHVQKKSLKRLLGCVIDYVDGLNGAGFKISNPNVKTSCGCGSSHGY